MQKKHTFEIQLNAIHDADNPTKKEVEFILHDFSVSHNYAFISKETAMSRLDTLKDMPIVCQYYPVSQAGAKDDALGGHAMYLEKSREDGSDFVAMDTFPIGVFTDPAYITNVEIDGELKEVVAGKGVLWASRYPNIVGLLKEWVDEGIPVTSSMEILYDTYKEEDGITEILNYCYEGHCLLNSADRGEHKKVYPAYDVSRLNKLAAQAFEQEFAAKEVTADMPEENKEVMEETVETVETVQEPEEKVVTEEVAVSEEVVEESEVSVSAKKKKPEDEEDKPEEETPSEEEDKSADDEEPSDEEDEEKKKKKKQANDQETLIAELEQKVSSLQAELEQAKALASEADEKVVQLNELVEALTPFKEQVEKELFEKNLQEKQAFYSAKFEALQAKEKFESEEVQSLIAASVHDTEEGKAATSQLNSMLVELVSLPVKEEVSEVAIKELASKRENLLPAEDSFEARYSL